MYDRNLFKEKISRPVKSLEKAIKILDDANFHKKFEKTIAEYPEIVKLIEKNAEAGNRDAQFWLGFIYLAGEGKKRDGKLAFEWLEKSSMNGSHKAPELLASLYYSGTACKICYQSTLHWYRVAIENGSETAIPPYIRAYKFICSGIKKCSA
jgi:uncharacterized protein